MHDRPSRRSRSGVIHHRPNDYGDIEAHGKVWNVTRDRFGNIGVDPKGDPLGKKGEGIYLQGSDANEYRDLTDRQIVDYLVSAGAI